MTAKSKRLMVFGDVRRGISVQLVDERKNAYRSRRASRHFHGSHHGNGAVRRHEIEVGYVGQQIESVRQGILTDCEYFGGAAIEIRGIDAEAEGIAAFL
jgi:hypothetical protein